MSSFKKTISVVTIVATVGSILLHSILAEGFRPLTGITMTVGVVILGMKLVVIVSNRLKDEMASGNKKADLVVILILALIISTASPLSLFWTMDNLWATINLLLATCGAKIGLYVFSEDT